jgi:pimeloyl-ACP methyl ester carboxylesterase
LVATDLAADLATLDLPLLLMMPDRSPYVSLAQASTLADLVPHAEIAVFPGARHGLPLSHATAAAGVLVDFLARVEVPSPRSSRGEG